MDYSSDDMIDYETGEDNYYSDDDDNTESDHGGLAEEDDVKQSQRSYVVLKEADIRKHQRDDIEKVSTFLSISKIEAIALLLHYHWSASNVEEEWFTDEERVRKTVGILKEPVVELSNGKRVRIRCGICFESYRRSKIETVACGHPYCKDCWRGYITTKIKDGPCCLTVKCPEPSCSAMVGQDMVDKVTKEEDKDKYYRFFLRSYIEDNGTKKWTKWCPSPGCEYAVDFDDNGSGYDVTCLCSYSFCMNCCEEAHSPVNCDTVSRWMVKNSGESETANWILANSKPCPQCKRLIQKNQGCNHMTCRAPCKFEFCWLCLDPWKMEEGHDYYKCNKYKSNPRDEAEIWRERAEQAIDRYIHYYERWASNHSSRKKAIADLEILQSEQLKELSAKQCKPETELGFIAEAWLQIIECRRVLKWTYAYGYYLPELTRAEKDFFEYLQGEAVSGLDRLHSCVEKELGLFLSETETEGFDAFQIKLAGLTKVTKTYFENLVKALENGLSDEAYSESKSPSPKRQKLV